MRRPVRDEYETLEEYAGALEKYIDRVQENIRRLPPRPSIDDWNEVWDSHWDEDEENYLADFVAECERLFPGIQIFLGKRDYRGYMTIHMVYPDDMEPHEYDHLFSLFADLHNTAGEEYCVKSLHANDRTAGLRRLTGTGEGG